MGRKETVGEGQQSVSHVLRLLLQSWAFSSTPSVRKRHTVLKKNLCPEGLHLCFFILERMETGYGPKATPGTWCCTSLNAVIQC